MQSKFNTQELIDQLSEVIESLRQENQSLHREVQSLRQENQSLHREVQSLDLEDQSLDLEDQSLDQENQSLDLENQVLIQENQSLRRGLRSLASENQGLNYEIAELHQQVDRLSKLYAFVCEENKELLEELNADKPLEQEASDTADSYVEDRILDNPPEVQVAALKAQIHIWKEFAEQRSAKLRSVIKENAELRKKSAKFQEEYNKSLEWLRVLTPDYDPSFNTHLSADTSTPRTRYQWIGGADGDLFQVEDIGAKKQKE